MTEKKEKEDSDGTKFVGKSRGGSQRRGLGKKRKGSVEATAVMRCLKKTKNGAK